MYANTTGKPFNPESLDGIMGFYWHTQDEKYASAAAWDSVITLPNVLRSTLDTPELVREFAHALAWKRQLQWSRSPWLMPVAPITNPHAEPAQEIHVRAWPGEGAATGNLDAQGLNVGPETWGPCLAAQLYRDQADFYAGAAAMFPESLTTGPVPMTFQWDRR